MTKCSTRLFKRSQNMNDLLLKTQTIVDNAWNFPGEVQDAIDGHDDIEEVAKAIVLIFCRHYITPVWYTAITWNEELMDCVTKEVASRVSGSLI